MKTDSILLPRINAASVGTVLTVLEKGFFV